MNTLFTAFKGANNASFRLINQIGRASLFLTNSFAGLKKDIDGLKTIPTVVYMFGVDKTLSDEVKIEVCAQNEETVIYSDYDIVSLSEQMAARNIHHEIASASTRYLCNSAYYHMLRKTKNTVFIHIPTAKGMTAEFMQKLIDLFAGI